MTDDPTEVEVAAMLHHRHARRALGYYWWADPNDRRSALRRLIFGRTPERPRPAWQTWNTRNMSDADELALIATFARAGLDVIEARRAA